MAEAVSTLAALAERPSRDGAQEAAEGTISVGRCMLGTE